MKLKWIGVLALTGSILTTSMPQAEAGFFITNILTFPIKTAGKVVKKTAGTVVKKGGKAVIKQANPVNKIRRTKRIVKTLKKAGKNSKKVYEKFDGK